jgi:hypothetical protein
MLLVFLVAHSIVVIPSRFGITFAAEEANILDMKCRAIICDRPLRGAVYIIIPYNNVE